jgi:cell shape-determining protein MreD
MINIKKISIILIFGLVSILIQGTIFRSLLPFGYVPNLLCALLVFLSLFEVTILGVFLAGLLGLLLDLFTSQLLGPWFGAYVFVFIILSIFAQRVYVGSILTFSIVVALSSVLSALIYLFMILPYLEISTSLITVLIVESFLTALFSPIIYWIIKLAYPRNQDKYGSLSKVL